MESENVCYKYNSVYKLLANALTFDPPQPPFKRGEKKGRRRGEEKVPLIKGDLGG